MIITVFRSRLNEAATDAYVELQPKIADLARTMPGFVSVKGFVADDGERCTIVEFEDEASHRAWARHPEHMAAQARGRNEFYESYDLKVGEVTRILSMGDHH